MTNIIPRLAIVISLLSLSTQPVPAVASTQSDRPNILIAISDDHSWIHTSIQGSAFVATPSLDSVASNGFLFSNAYAGSPGCSPSRAALLTGQHHWMIGPAGTHGSSFPVQYQTFVDLLEDAGYKVGFTGKGWGPGKALDSGGKPRLLTGKPYSKHKAKPPAAKISSNDYARNFEEFLAEAKAGDKPWCF